MLFCRGELTLKRLLPFCWLFLSYMRRTINCMRLLLLYNNIRVYMNTFLNDEGWKTIWYGNRLSSAHQNMHKVKFSLYQISTPFIFHAVLWHCIFRQLIYSNKKQVHLFYKANTYLILQSYRNRMTMMRLHMKIQCIENRREIH